MCQVVSVLEFWRKQSIVLIMWLLRCVAALLCLAVGLKVCESWLFDYDSKDGGWLGVYSNHPQDMHEEWDHDEDWTVDRQARRFERSFFADHAQPSFNSRRCDACRLIAARFDHAFEVAESKVGIRSHATDEYEELADEDVSEVVGKVCHKANYRFVVPLRVRNKDRLAASGLETIAHLSTSLSAPDDSDSPDVDWPQRLRNHCRHYVDQLKGRDVYEMWLRTSAGMANTGHGFEQFMCFGEGVYGDCVEEYKISDAEGQEIWPAGDDVDEDGEEEDNGEEVSEFYLADHAVFRNHPYVSSSATPSM